MKLGILVIYMVSEQYGRLMELHLRQIEQCTTVPFTLYAAPVRLRPEFREVLLKHPHVTICDCPPTDLRMGQEHTYYLERLVQRALADGVTHIAMLHVDSFPIQLGWAEILSNRLSEHCVLAVVTPSQFTSCLFCRSDFLLSHRPTLRLTKADKQTPESKRLRQAFGYRDETGTGYLLAAYRLGLTWYSLQASTTAGQPYTFSLYDDLIFHLGGVNRHAAKAQAHKKEPSPALWQRSVFETRRLARRALPAPIRRRFWRMLGAKTQRRLAKPLLEFSQAAFLEDPETLLNKFLNRRNAGVEQPMALP